MTTCRPRRTSPPSRTYVVGVDVGTTGVEAVLVDDAYEVRASAAQEYATAFPAGGGAEQDPDDWWRAAAACVRQVLRRAGVDPARVAAVGVSGQAPSVAPVDAGLRPVRPALLWMDRRGHAECAVRAGAAAELLARTGNRLDAYFAGPTLAWFARAEPQLAARTSTVLMASGYVVGRLTGVATCDTGHAGLTLLADLGADGWAPDLATLWGVPTRWLPELAEPTAVVGRVRADAAAVTDLAVGTPVVAGGVDGVTASLAAGVRAHGDVCEMTGQSTVVNAAFDASAFARAVDSGRWTGGLSVLPYPVAGHHLVYGSMVATGGILRWFRDEFASAAADDDDFARLDALAGTSAPGAGGLVLLPYFLGERSPVWDPAARGALVGLSMSTRRADVVRAILEGTAYGLRHNLEELAAIGLRPAEVRAVGGGARGATWTQVKADVTGLAFRPTGDSPSASYGAALLAAAGAGLTDDLPGTARALADRAAAAGQATVVRPDAARHRTYDRYYRAYRELYPALRRVYDVLTGD